MTKVALLQLAQATAATVVTGSASALAADQAMVNAFVGTGNPATDYPGFKQSFGRELQSYRQAAQADAAPATAPGAGPRTQAISAEVFAKLPPDMQARLVAANPALANVVAAAPAPVSATAAAPVASAPPAA